MTFLEPRDDFDGCIVGICYTEDRAVYDLDLVIKALMASNSFNEDEAEEWFYSNVERSAAYQDSPPIFMRKEFDLEEL